MKRWRSSSASPRFPENLFEGRIGKHTPRNTRMRFRLFGMEGLKGEAYPYS
jgi:hypothetical protein